jgi:hypothetical protein
MAQHCQTGKLLMVPADSLNIQLTIKPDAHIFNASKANWDKSLQDIPMLAGSPVSAET